MSYDYSVVVRGRKRTPDQIRAVAAKVLASYPGAAVLKPDEHDEDEDDGEMALRIALPGRTVTELDGVREGRPGRASGGTILIARLRRGYQLSIDSTVDGNPEAFTESRVGGPSRRTTNEVLRSSSSTPSPLNRPSAQGRATHPVTHVGSDADAMVPVRSAVRLVGVPPPVVLTRNTSSPPE
jgi:hypothetical protein